MMLHYFSKHKETKITPLPQITHKNKNLHSCPISMSRRFPDFSPSLQRSAHLGSGTVPSLASVLAPSSKEGPGNRLCVRGLFGAPPCLNFTLSNWLYVLGWTKEWLLFPSRYFSPRLPASPVTWVSCPKNWFSFHQNTTNPLHVFCSHLISTVIFLKHVSNSLSLPLINQWQRKNKPTLMHITFWTDAWAGSQQPQKSKIILGLEDTTPIYI